MIDLEDNYDISSFKMYDCKTLVPQDPNVDHYKISVSADTPDLSKITPAGDQNTCWTTVVERYDTQSENIKEDKLDTSVSARYVKFELPRVKKDGKEYNTTTHRIYALDVFGKKSDSSGTETIVAESVETPAEYFDLQGRKVNQPQTGVYVSRQGSKVSKVFVK